MENEWRCILWGPHAQRLPLSRSGELPGDPEAAGSQSTVWRFGNLEGYGGAHPQSLPRFPVLSGGLCEHHVFQMLWKLYVTCVGLRDGFCDRVRDLAPESTMAWAGGRQVTGSRRGTNIGLDCSGGWHPAMISPCHAGWNSQPNRPSVLLPGPYPSKHIKL